MPFLPDDDHFLHHALGLAADAAAFASPNPAVGCVLVRGDHALAEGAHLYDQRDHAEIAALKQAAERGLDVRGATAYVTLEPCAHHGRTGPCAKALVQAGIGRCVVATVDPNPLVRGQGLRILQNEGLEVVVADPTSEIAQRARRLNDAFAFAIQHGRPFVTLKAAVSSDERLAPPAHLRRATAPHWLTDRAARADVQRLRHASDVLLTGIGTVLADDPELTDRTGLPRRRPLLRVVIDTHLRIPLTSRLVRSAAEDLLVFCDYRTPQEPEEALRHAGVEVVRVGLHQGRLSLDLVLEYLDGRAFRSVLLEAGPGLNGSLLTDDLVDRVVLYRAPLSLGPDALPFAQNGPTPHALVPRLTGLEEHRFSRDDGGEDLRLSGYLHDPWAALLPTPNAIP